MSKELQEIAHEIRNQDSRATAHPIFEVREWKRIWGMLADYSDKYQWIDCDDPENIADKERHEDLDSRCDGNDIFEGWSRVYYIDVEVTVQPFFTEKAANDYIRMNRHNLRRPFTYVQSGYRNPEWQVVTKMLKEKY